MNQAIADIIKGHIQNLDFVDKIAGLTSVLTFDMKGKDNAVVQKSFPVACCVTPDECEKNGAYNDLMPNSEYKSVIYFEDEGVTFVKAESNWKYYKSSLRLVAWLNIEKLTESGICKSEIPCTYAAHVITEIIRALPEFPHSHSPIERFYSEITNQLVRNPSIFSAYTYDEKHTQFLLAPFDYFALTIETGFAICLSSRVVPSSICVPDIIPIPVIIDPPTLFSATAISDTQVDLAWTNNALNQAVIIERSLNGNDWIELYRTIAGDVAYSNTELTAGTRYYYRIRAFDGGNLSAYTNVEDITTTWSSFVMTFDTELVGSATKTVVIPTYSNGYDCVVNWGDGLSDAYVGGTLNAAGTITHVYAIAGIKTVSISGTFPQIYFANGGDKLKLKTIANWGSGAWRQMHYAFFGCGNIIGTYIDVPNTSNVTDMVSMFNGCTIFNSPVSFDTSGVTNMANMFKFCTIFNQSVSSFNTSSVTNMSYLFAECNAFNQSVSNFDTSNVTNMIEMFCNDFAFNQSVSGFNTSKVTDMSLMFGGCSVFNQPVSNFNTSKVTNMVNMFADCYLFNQNVSGFDVHLVTSMANMFANADTLSTTNYDALLIAWAGQVVKSNVTFDVGEAKYSAGAAARGVLTSAPNNWTITDGGPV